jgi:hypothetical protein
MADRFVQSHIRRLPLFERLSDRELGLISTAFQVMRFEPGEVVFYQGQPARGMYMFVSGQGALVQTGPDGIERSIGMVGENQYLNEAALYRQITETATMHIVETAIVLVLPRQRLLTLLAHHPEIRSGLGLPVHETVEPAQTNVFAGQRENEDVLAATRRHWWAFGRFGVILGALGVVMLIGALLMPVPLLTVGLMGLAVIVPGLGLVYAYLEWRNDLVIITDERVVRIERTLLTFSTRVSELPLTSIHEANAEIPATDAFARLFHYGPLEIKSAGRAGNMTLEFMPHPNDLQNLIFEDMDHQKSRLSEQQQQAIRAEIDRALGSELARTPVGGRTPAPADHAPQQHDSRTGFALIRLRYTDANGATVYRKHWMVWLRHVFLPGMVIVGAGVLFLLWLFLPSFQDLGIVGAVLAFFVGLLGLIWFYWSDWDWRYDLYTVGDETITLVHRRPLWLQNEKDQILLNSVDNVSSNISGIFQNLFNYGDVRISLLGADRENVKVFEKVSHPREVQAEISRRRERTRQLAADADEQRQRQVIGEYLKVYHDTVSQDGTYPPTAQSQSAPGEQAAPPGQDGSRPPGVPRIRRD